ncbi:alpha/beta fold hydrolase [Candidatus Woesearchaeota archaeon]|nr:alpha/beta fold hydrolase [Candidatus Woesearchaeota archaeon]
METRAIRSFDGTSIYYTYDPGQRDQGRSRYCGNKDGDKECMVFVHGAGANHTIWSAYLERFRDKRIIAPDLRGHGRSSRGRMSISRCAKDLKAVLDHEGMEKAVLVAHSLGSAVSVEFYRQNPGMVSRLVLMNIFSKEYIRLGATFALFNSALVKILRKLNSRRKLRFQDYEKLRKKAFFRYAIADFRGTSYTAYFGALQELFRYNLCLDTLEVPVMLLQGTRDIFSDNSRILARTANNPNISIKLLRAGHLTPLREGDVIPLIERFMKHDPRRD